MKDVPHSLWMEDLSSDVTRLGKALFSVLYACFAQLLQVTFLGTVESREPEPERSFGTSEMRLLMLSVPIVLWMPVSASVTQSWFAEVLREICEYDIVITIIMEGNTLFQARNLAYRGVVRLHLCNNRVGAVVVEAEASKVAGAP